MTGLLTLLVLGTVLLLLMHHSGVLALETPTGDMELDSISAIERLLPQTQCGKCHYDGCRPYAEAIAGGRADINRCPPGGETTIQAIAELLGREPKPLSPEVQEETPPLVAMIDENLCIGCVKCIRACPVDAIMGAPKRMHTVIKKYCTGCELCIAPCPVDCISMVPVRVKTTEWVWSRPDPANGPRP